MTTIDYGKRLGFFAFLITALSFSALAQDALTLEGGSGNAGSAVELSLFVRDVQGTVLDTDDEAESNFFGFNIGFSFDASLVDSVEWERAGLTTSQNPLFFIDFSEVQNGTSALGVGFNESMALTLGAASPGDLVAKLRLVPSAAAEGRTIQFTVNQSQTSLVGLQGGIELNIANGTLAVNIGSVTVDGDPPDDLPVINSFTANPTTIEVGSSSTLSWSVSNATSVTINQGVGSVPGSSNRVVSPSVTTDYTLTASNSQGNVQATVRVTVIPVNSGDPPVIDLFSANPSTIAPDGSSTLQWTVRDADFVSIDQGIGTVDSSASRSVSPDATTTYQLTATNEFGTARQSVTVTVSSAGAPVVNNFSVTPSQIAEGESATLAWDIDNADAVDIDNGIGRVDSQGSVIVSPTETTEYTLLASNQDDEVLVKTTLLVASKPRINSFTANPEEILAGQSSTLSWDVQNATSLTLNPGNLDVTTANTLTVRPTETTTYTLTATGAGGESSANAVVTVTGAPSLMLNATEIPFGSTTGSLQVRLSANTDQAFNWSLAQAPEWLTITPEEGSVAAGETQVVRLIPDRDFLFPGQDVTENLAFQAQGFDNATAQVSVARAEQRNGESYLFFPLADSGTEKITHLGVTNLENQSVEMTLLIFDRDGSRVDEPLVQELGALASFSHTIESLESGWAVATLSWDASNTGPAGSGVANIRARDGEELVALNPVSSAAEFLYVPHIAADLNTFYTLGAAANISTETSNLFLDATETDGFDVEDLSSGSHAFFNFADAMGGTIQGPGWGSLSLNEANDSRMIGAEVFGRTAQSGLRQSVGVGLSSQASQELYFVHIASDTSRFWTGIVVINLGESSADIQFEAFDTSGQLIGTGQVESFAAGEKRTFLVSSDSIPFGDDAAWLRVTSSFPMIGYELFGTWAPADQFAGFESISGLSNRLAIPHTEDGVSEGGWTGVAIINPGSSAAVATARLVAADGTVKETQEVTIEPKEKLVQLVSTLFETSIAAGDVVLVESPENVAGFVLYGSGTTTMGALVAWPY
ncbi:BACON domain-containing protein [Sulfidibacter corallicola]|uniref:BACON domain-containing protein n=1 Tax=Sulfidibacter corallicola TaxID=2818388 RepID=A0A8A4TDA5_SULCO|nr:hypothetical protein [Sulfidibacter corallicola]QTD47550.1 hypothetical protein J3U87_18315 [Sulfidibacter corallicola]